MKNPDHRTTEPASAVIGHPALVCASPAVAKVLRDSRIVIKSCITMIERLGQGDTCSDMREVVSEIDELIGPTP